MVEFALKELAYEKVSKSACCVLSSGFEGVQLFVEKK